MERPRTIVDAGGPGVGRRPVVACIRWPADEAQRRRLASERVPRLLVVEPGVAPPLVEDELEDWVGEASDEEDVLRRVANLEARVRAGR